MIVWKASELWAFIAFAHFDKCLNILSCIKAHSPRINLTQLNTPILKLGQGDFSTTLQLLKFVVRCECNGDQYRRINYYGVISKSFIHF